MNLEKQIDSILDTIVGQVVAKMQIKHWILGAAMGDGYLEPLLISGELGRGKSEFIKAIVEILRVACPAKVGNIHKCNKGTEVGPMSSFIQDIVANYIHDKDGAIIIDEFADTPRATMSFIRNMIAPNIDRSPVIINEGGSEIIVDPRRFAFIFASNETERIDAGLKTRCKEVALQEFLDSEIAEILTRGIEKNGIRFDENSVQSLAKTCRGTARDVVHIVNDMVKLIRMKGKKSINKADVKELLTIRNVKPDGINETELKTLLYLEKDGALQLQQISCRLGLESKQQKLNEIYLFRKGFMTVGQKREITSDGRKYLEYLRKHKFIEPAPKPTNVC